MNQIQEEEFVALSRQQANQLIPSLESAYYGLVLQGKYLPKMNSSIITSEYLLGVLFDTNYVPLIKEINIGVLLKPIKKLDLIEELLKVQINGQKWGIDLKHTPNKEWIVNVLKTLKPDHAIFKTQTEIGQFDMKKFSIDQINKIKELEDTKIFSICFEIYHEQTYSNIKKKQSSSSPLFLYFFSKILKENYRFQNSVAVRARLKYTSEIKSFLKINNFI